LIGDEQTLADLARYGEAQMSIIEAGIALGASGPNLNRLLVEDGDARSAYEGGQMRGLAALRLAQLETARTNATMALFVGRTYFGLGETREAQDEQVFDVSAARERLQQRVAALLAAPASQEDRQGN